MRPTCGPVAAAGLHATFNNLVSFLRNRETIESCFADTSNKMRANPIRYAKPLKNKAFTQIQRDCLASME
jgi:hypothetical protein